LDEGLHDLFKKIPPDELSGLRIIRKAGLKPWPKLFQNLRATRETELSEIFPSHVVCQWIGHTQEVAKKHYLQVTEDHFARAVETTENPPQANSALLNLLLKGGEKRCNNAHADPEGAVVTAYNSPTCIDLPSNVNMFSCPKWSNESVNSKNLLYFALLQNLRLSWIEIVFCCD